MLLYINRSLIESQNAIPDWIQYVTRVPSVALILTQADFDIAQIIVELGMSGAIGVQFSAEVSCDHARFLTHLSNASVCLISCASSPSKQRAGCDRMSEQRPLLPQHLLLGHSRLEYCTFNSVTTNAHG